MRVFLSSRKPKLSNCSLIEFRNAHSSLGSGSNPKVKTHPETIWNLVWLCTVVEKNQFGKIFIGGPSRKFKNLVKKWKILKFFLMCIWTQVWLSIISKKISNFFFLWPNFFHGARTYKVMKKIFVAKFLVYWKSKLVQVWNIMLYAFKSWFLGEDIQSYC